MNVQPTKHLLLPLLFFFVSTIATAQVTTFIRDYDIWSESSMNNFQQTSDGGYILSTDAVYEQDPGSIGKGYIVKSDAQGITQWTKTYPKTSMSIKPSDGNSIFQTSDGGYIVGTGEYSSGGMSTIRLIKIDANANLQWTRLYPGLGVGTCYCVKQTADGGYILCGNTHDLSTWVDQIYILKTDNSGIPQWGKIFRESISPTGSAQSVNQTADGGYIMCGQTVSGGFLIKTDASGVITWDRIVEGSFFNSSIQTSDGGYVVTGTVTTANISNPAVLKFDASGNLQWANEYEFGANYGTGTSIAQNPDGTFTLVGYAMATNWSYILFLLKIDGSGLVMWSHGYYQSMNFYYCLDATTDGGYAFTSTWQDPSMLIPGPCIIKTDQDGYIDCNHNSSTATRSSISPLIFSGFTSSDAAPSSPSTILLTAVTVMETECAAIEPADSTSGPPLPFPMDTSEAIPNVFTPNGDGTNDYFQVVDDGIGSYHLEIYDRWGVLIFVSDNRNVYWDGTYMKNGKMVSDGTYYYIFGAGEEAHQTGFLTLIR